MRGVCFYNNLLTDMQRFTLFPKGKFMNSQSDEETDEGNAEK